MTVSTFDFVADGVLVLAAAISGGAGSSGGSLYIPILILVLHQTTFVGYTKSLTTATVLTVSILNMIVELYQRCKFNRQQAKSRTKRFKLVNFIRYDVVSQMIPLSVLGASIGVRLNKMLPFYIIAALLLILFIASGFKTFKKLRKLYNASEKAQQIVQSVINTLSRRGRSTNNNAGVITSSLVTSKGTNFSTRAVASVNYSKLSKISNVSTISELEEQNVNSLNCSDNNINNMQFKIRYDIDTVHTSTTDADTNETESLTSVSDSSVSVESIDSHIMWHNNYNYNAYNEFDAQTANKIISSQNQTVNILYGGMKQTQYSEFNASDTNSFINSTTITNANVIANDQTKQQILNKNDENDMIGLNNNNNNKYKKKHSIRSGRSYKKNKHSYSRRKRSLFATSSIYENLMRPVAWRNIVLILFVWVSVIVLNATINGDLKMILDVKCGTFRFWMVALVMTVFLLLCYAFARIITRMYNHWIIMCIIDLFFLFFFI